MKLYDLLDGVLLTGGMTNLDMEINSISYDSRTLRPGALFVALPGEKTDGHRFIRQALSGGARAVLCQQLPEESGPWLITPHPRQALARISANWFGHPQDDMTLIGVTGTNGKTTTTYLIKEMLEHVVGAKVGLIGTNRNLIGQEELPASRTTPESYELQGLLRRMTDAGCSHVVMEVSSHALVQHRVDGLTFDVGVFTNLTQDHLDYHQSMEAYRQAKSRLFDQSRQAVLNLDDEAGRYYAGRCTGSVFTYSERHDEADLTARNLRLFPDHVEFEAVTWGKLARVHLPIPGGFTVYNALAALAAGLCLGLDLLSMANALSRVKGVKGRIEVVPVPVPFTVLIDYAHSPNALENILTTVRNFTTGRVICLFGCGGDRDRSKRSIMGNVVRELADLAVVTTDNPRTEDPEAIIQDILRGMEPLEGAVHVEPDRVAAIGWALEQGRAGDVIILAGKGHETYQEVQGEYLTLDERAVVADWVQMQNAAEKAGKESALIV